MLLIAATSIDAPTPRQAVLHPFGDRPSWARPDPGTDDREPSCR